MLFFAVAWRSRFAADMGMDGSRALRTLCRGSALA